MKRIKYIGFVVFLIVYGGFGANGNPTGMQDPTKNDPIGDQLAIAVQQICPVSGEKLGSAGEPIRVTIGEKKQTVFLCSEECKKGKLDPEHWKTIHKNIAQAQGLCPIMKKALPQGAKWTVVQGRLIYVCCPPCIAKIEAEPEVNLDLIAKQYRQWLQSQSDSIDK
jgi:hypothetical protein